MTEPLTCAELIVIIGGIAITGVIAIVTHLVERHRAHMSAHTEQWEVPR